MENRFLVPELREFLAQDGKKTHRRISQASHLHITDVLRPPTLKEIQRPFLSVDPRSRKILSNAWMHVNAVLQNNLPFCIDADENTPAYYVIPLPGPTALQIERGGKRC
jgi:hypothetical protein